MVGRSKPMLGYGCQVGVGWYFKVLVCDQGLG